MATFNGHKNWNYWNVSLWIYNDEGLYRLARRSRLKNRNATEAAQEFLDCMDGVSKTPDGAPYTLGSVRAAMKDIL